MTLALFHSSCTPGNVGDTGHFISDVGLLLERNALSCVTPLFILGNYAVLASFTD